MSGTEQANYCWLCVEDSPEDYDVFKRTVKKAELPVTLLHCRDIEETIDLLDNFDDTSCAERKVGPDIVFLDLNLPGADGYHVLKKVRARQGMKKTPIIVLSTSSNQEDVCKAYEMGANCYIAKPQDLQSYKEMVEALKMFWIDQAMIPKTIKRQFDAF